MHCRVLLRVPPNNSASQRPLALSTPAELFYFSELPPVFSPFDSSQNREHPMPPDRIKVGSCGWTLAGAYYEKVLRFPIAPRAAFNVHEHRLWTGTPATRR